MKTIQELYGEVIASDELKQAFVEAMKANTLEDFLKENGCEATAEEVKEFIETKSGEDAPIELSDSEIKHVAAGSGIHSETCYCTGKTCGCSNTCIRDCC